MPSSQNARSALVKRKREDLANIDNWRPTQCCRKDCISVIGLERCRALREIFLKHERDERKAMLLEFVQHDEDSDEWKIAVDGVISCWMFNKKVLDCSKTLVSNVRRLPSANASHLPGRLRGADGSNLKVSHIIAFLRTLADEIADEIPNSNHRHLPHGTKKLVFVLYFETEKLSGREPCTASHFYRAWKTYLPSIRCRRNHGFSCCDTCISFKERLLGLARVPSAARERNIVMSGFRQHLKTIRLERAEYARVRALATEQPNANLSVIIDGADQQKFSLPKFAVTGKRETGSAMKQKVTGVLFHGCLEKNDFLSFFTSADNVPAGANQTIDAFCRALFVLLEKRKALGNIARLSDLYVQLDNTGKDNKNRYFFAFCDLLIHKGLFRRVTVNFLPVGHTHEDIDRKFSHVSTHLRHLNVVTVNELQDALGESQGRSRPHVARVSWMNNFSGALNDQGCVIATMSNLQTYRKFTFEIDEGSPGRKVSCKAGMSMITKRSNWVTLPVLEQNIGAFLKNIPDMCRAPPVTLKRYNEEELKSISTRLRKTETRIADRLKFQELQDELDRLANPSVSTPEWNFRSLLAILDSLEDPSDELLAQEEEGQVEADDGLTYNVGEMITVNCGLQATSVTPFWVACIKEVRQEVGQVATLMVQWYEVCPERVETPNLCYRGRYRPLQNFDDISASSVLVNFDALTITKHLPVTVQKMTTEALDPFRSDEDGEDEVN